MDRERANRHADADTSHDEEASVRGVRTVRVSLVRCDSPVNLAVVVVVYPVGYEAQCDGDDQAAEDDRDLRLQWRV